MGDLTDRDGNAEMSTSPTLPNVQATAPERIYLVIGDDVEPDTDFAELDRLGGVSWCADKIDDNSIEYVRADLASLPAVQGEQPRTLNDWFLSLPEGRQAVLRDDKWMLADAAFQAGLKASQAARTSSVAAGRLPSAQPNAKDGLVDPVVPTTEPPGATLYATCHECGNCGHIGINDEHDTDAACTHCDWRGRSPAEDHCPGCGSTGTMTTACPECGSRYRLLAEAQLPAPGATLLPGAASQWISVDERLPKDPAQECLVYWGTSFGRPLYGIATLSTPWKGNLLWHGHRGSHADVTFWQPITQPTSQVEQGESSSKGGES